MKQLQVKKNEAVVFEDSLNGMMAANRADILVVAVPNLVTALLSLEDANLIPKDLNDITLSELIRLI